MRSIKKITSWPQIAFLEKLCYSAIALALFLYNEQALAIPSPDLVINLSASVAQLLGLLSVVFGGFAMSAKKKSHKQQRAPSLGGKILLSTAAIMLVASLAANVLQYTHTLDAKNQRLHTNLLRKSIENGETVGDTNLKTLSFSDQLDHPQGISTQTLADWLSNDVPLNIIDVRENEEFETGAIEGAAHLRYPDVLARASLLPDNTNTLLVCYSGNRSSELCGELTKQGKTCNFMMGGYEKWLTENRPLSSNVHLSTDDLRQLPDFKNKATLLDTPDVHRLVNETGAQFLDVRYPNDFAKNHLPNAINITMRSLSSADLSDRITALPDVPYIAACYDKRSCFYSQLIGLRLERAGLDFRGRYTVPHEYYVNRPSEIAHIENWKQNQQVTLASYIVKPMRGFLDKLVELTGHYVLGLFVVVLLIRLLLLPISLKAERDTRVQKSLSGHIANLKEELSEHPQALSEATMQLYRRFNIRPVINILASLFQLTLMLLFYTAVSHSSNDWSQPFLWLKSASSPDPLYILPSITTGLFLAVLVLQSPVKTVRKALLFTLAGAVLFWMLQSLGSAVNLYLGFSMVFLIIQTAFFRILNNILDWDNAGTQKTRSIKDTGLIPLSQAHLLPDSTGKKAARLGELIEAGYNVPNGFVFTSIITNRTRSHSAQPLLNKAQSRQLNKLWKSLNTEKVAVRSSGANEDGVDNSFAGVYESILNVEQQGLEAAVREVYQSLCSDRSIAYTQMSAEEDAVIPFDQGGVVVQKMVPAEFAGVMFTEHPSSTGAMMIEMVTGLGEELVSGTVTPDTFAFGKLTGQLLEEASSSTHLPTIELEPLLVLGRELESLFGQPQDIEWAYAKGRFYLLQSRDITRSVSHGTSLKSLAERERKKLLKNLLGERKRLRKSEKPSANDPVYVQSELSELLPRPTPFSGDFMERLWSSGGSTDLACQELGIPYSVHFRSMPYINTIFGWTYVNKREERQRLGKGPNALASFRLARNAEKTEAHFREEFLPTFQSEMVERKAIDMQRLNLEEATLLLQMWTDRFIQETYCTAERINISADYHMKNALDKLKSSGMEPTQFLTDDEDTVVSQAMSLLNKNSVTRESIDEFLQIFGHRAPLDYELSAPRFSEDLTLVQQYIQRSEQSHSDFDIKIPPVEADSDSTYQNKKILAISIERARAFMRLKEEAKHFCLIELAQIRRLLLAIDEKCEMNNHIFQLTLNEVMKLPDRSLHLKLVAVAERRAEESRAWKHLQLPASLSLSDLERIDMLTGSLPNSTEQGELHGKRVAGEQEVTGVVRVIVDIDQINTFKKGEILVARMTDPTWYPLFSQARGIITEVGGWLSHAAIVARECDLPAIVGVSGVCQRLKTGDLITMRLSGSIEHVAEREQAAHSDTATVQADTPPSAQTASGYTTNDEGYVPTKKTNEQLSSKLNRSQQTIERRALKNQLGDRRAQPRLRASGEIRPDRRAANRAENALQMKKTG